MWYFVALSVVLCVVLRRTLCGTSSHSVWVLRHTVCSTLCSTSTNREWLQDVVRCSRVGVAGSRVGLQAVGSGCRQSGRVAESVGSGCRQSGRVGRQSGRVGSRVASSRVTGSRVAVGCTNWLHLSQSFAPWSWEKWSNIASWSPTTMSNFCLASLWLVGAHALEMGAMAYSGQAYFGQTYFGHDLLRPRPTQATTHFGHDNFGHDPLWPRPTLARPTLASLGLAIWASLADFWLRHGNCRCTQRACNDRSRVHQAATVGARLSPPRQNPREKKKDLHNRHQSPCQCTATGESRWKLNRTMGICLCAMTRMSATSDGLQLRRLHSLHP